MIEGFTAPGFEPVRDELERNFTERGDLGAAFAATLDGETVVDLWGGIADRQSASPWREDTLQVIFSGTKALVGVCLLMLIDRGQLAFEAPVSRYWPEFAAQGKETIKVSEIASHQARLPVVRRPLSQNDICDGVALAAMLAQQPQEQDPRAASLYHPLTYGWLCGELVRRIDGRSVGRFFAEEVAAPLGLEVWIGLPAEQEDRVGTLHQTESWIESLGALDEQDELMRLLLANPPQFTGDPLPWNTREYHAAEIPAAGAIATARAIARLYGCLARGGELDGVRLLQEATIARAQQCLMRTQETAFSPNEAYGFGLELQTEEQPFGPCETGFGYNGAGGSVHGAWPTRRVGFSYCMNEMRPYHGDVRAKSLLKALYESL